jgi:preprotein translocase subunit SecF
MLRLAAMLNPIVGTSLAGTLVIVVLLTGQDAVTTLLAAGVAGYVLGMGASALIARAILARRPAARPGAA